MNIVKSILFSALLVPIAVQAQNPQKQPILTNNLSSTPARPRLMVGLVVDQMRWDYLYRYANRYGAGGFKRM